MEENEVANMATPGITFSPDALATGLRELQRGQEIFDRERNASHRERLLETQRRAALSVKLLGTICEWAEMRGDAGGLSRWEEIAIADISCDLLQFSAQLANLRESNLSNLLQLRWAKDANPLSPKEG